MEALLFLLAGGGGIPLYPFRMGMGEGGSRLVDTGAGARFLFPL